MNPIIPFCPRCGDPRVLVRGSHPGETGVVQWAMYMCGHTRSGVAEADLTVQLEPSVPASA
jgi:hypothetical protein